VSCSQLSVEGRGTFFKHHSRCCLMQRASRQYLHIPQTDALHWLRLIKSPLTWHICYTLAQVTAAAMPTC
jgi:hypothetical protein